MILVLAWFSIPQVWGQQSTRRMLEVLDQEGKEDCEVWQINDFLYKPVRINLVHQPINTHQVSITTEGDGEVLWDGSKESFQLVARDTDRYTAEIILDYELKHEEPRQVFFQVIAGDRKLMMEGNWVHEGFTFCKIIDFFAQEAPTELTEEEIIEINNKFNAEFREDQSLSNTILETGILILAVVVAVVGIMSTIYFFIIIISQRSMARITKRPEKKLNEMIGKVRKLAEVMTLQSQYNMTTDKENRDKIYKKIEDALRDLAIMAVGTKNKVQLDSSFPSAESLVDVSESTPVDTEKDEKQKKEDEKSYAEGYGVEKQQQEKEEITFVTLNQPEEEKPESETVEMNIKDVKPCVYCGKAPMYICKDCGKTFCEEHESHNCKGKEEKSVGTTEKISDKIAEVIKSVMEKKDSITNDDKLMQKQLDEGKTKMDAKNDLIKEYMKIPYKEARELYDDMVKKYDKKKTFLDAIRLEAMMERLVRSDT